MRRLPAVMIAALSFAAVPSAGPASAQSASRGADIYNRQCLVCHATAAEFHKEGPSLAGVYGRKAGAAPFFAGYKGLKGADFVWNETTLDTWLADPRRLLAGRDTGMTLRVADPAQRADLIAYIRTLR